MRIQHHGSKLYKKDDVVERSSSRREKKVSEEYEPCCSVRDDDKQLLKELKKSIYKMEQLRLTQSHHLITTTNSSHSRTSNVKCDDPALMNGIYSNGLDLSINGSLKVPNHLKSIKESSRRLQDLIGQQKLKESRELYKLNVYGESLERQKVLLDRKLNEIYQTAVLDLKKTKRPTTSKNPEFDTVGVMMMTMDDDHDTNKRSQQASPDMKRIEHTNHDAVVSDLVHVNDANMMTKNPSVDLLKTTLRFKKKMSDLEPTLLPPNSSVYRKSKEIHHLDETMAMSETELSRKLLTQIEYIESLEKAQNRLSILGYRGKSELGVSAHQRSSTHSNLRPFEVKRVSSVLKEPPIPSTKPPAQMATSLPVSSSNFSLGPTMPPSPSSTIRARKISKFSRDLSTKTSATTRSQPLIDEFEEMKQKRNSQKYPHDRRAQISTLTSSYPTLLDSHHRGPAESMMLSPTNLGVISPRHHGYRSHSDHQDLLLSDLEHAHPFLPSSINARTLSQLPDDMLLEAIKLKIEKMKTQLIEKPIQRSITALAQVELDFQEQFRRHHRPSHTELATTTIPSPSYFSVTQVGSSYNNDKKDFIRPTPEMTLIDNQELDTRFLKASTLVDDLKEPRLHHSSVQFSVETQNEIQIGDSRVFNRFQDIDSFKSRDAMLLSRRATEDYFENDVDSSRFLGIFGNPEACLDGNRDPSELDSDCLKFSPEKIAKKLQRKGISFTQADDQETQLSISRTLLVSNSIEISQSKSFEHTYQDLSDTPKDFPMSSVQQKSPCEATPFTESPLVPKEAMISSPSWTFDSVDTAPAIRSIPFSPTRESPAKPPEISIESHSTDPLVINTMSSTVVFAEGDQSSENLNSAGTNEQSKVAPSHLPSADSTKKSSASFKPHENSLLIPEWSSSIKILLNSIEDHTLYDHPPLIHSENPNHLLFSEFINECLSDAFKVSPHRNRLLKTFFQNAKHGLSGSYLKKIVLGRAFELKSRSSAEFMECLLIDDISISEADWIDYDREKKLMHEETQQETLVSTSQFVPSPFTIEQHKFDITCS